MTCTFEASLVQFGQSSASFFNVTKAVLLGGHSDSGFRCWDLCSRGFRLSRGASSSSRAEQSWRSDVFFTCTCLHQGLNPPQELSSTNPSFRKGGTKCMADKLLPRRFDRFAQLYRKWMAKAPCSECSPCISVYFDFCMFNCGQCFGAGRSLGGLRHVSQAEIGEHIWGLINIPSPKMSMGKFFSI